LKQKKPKKQSIDELRGRLILVHNSTVWLRYFW